MLEKLVEWGKKDDNIRALILLGSRAGRQPVDAFSDYDLSGFCDANEAYTGSDSWKALYNTMELFRRITADTAQALRFSSMEDSSGNMMGFINTLKSSPL